MDQSQMAVETDWPERDSAEDNILLGVLDVVERDPGVTQRSVARELGIALGLANAYLKRCARKGLIKVSQVPRRRYAYYLTPQGFAEKSRLTATYLSHSFSFFRTARAQCGDVFVGMVARGYRRVMLVGAGDLAEIARLVAPDHPVEIVGTIAVTDDVPTLTASAAGFGAVDAVLVTALERPREVFAAALTAFGPERVFAPVLLRVHPPASKTQPASNGAAKLKDATL
ncbi:MAG: winged helix-turn-helix transcriptional regulator [Pseudorhodoplanes sp.]